MNSEHLPCLDVREKLSDWLDGELTPEQRRAMDGHLGACADCARERRDLERTLALLRGLPRESAPQGFKTAVLGKLAQAQAGGAQSVLRRWGPWLGGLAAAASLLLLAQLDFVSHLGHGPGDEALEAKMAVDTPRAFRAQAPAPPSSVAEASAKSAVAGLEDLAEPALLAFALAAADPEAERDRIETWLTRLRSEESGGGRVDRLRLAREPSMDAQARGASSGGALADQDTGVGAGGEAAGPAAAAPAAPPSSTDRPARKHEARDASVEVAAAKVLVLDLSREEYKRFLAEFGPTPPLDEGREAHRFARAADEKEKSQATRVRLRIEIHKTP